jgi:hypothetical protein
MSDAKLEAWQEAGLIDAATAARIRAWEAEHARPLGLWAAIGLAALAIGLGLMSLVAANWEAIPGGVRLSIHFAMILATAALLWFKQRDWAEKPAVLQEAALFVFGVLGLTFLGHVGQVYQTIAPLWQMLALWLVLFGPLLVARGQGWMTAGMLMLTLLVAVWHYATTVAAPNEALNTSGATIRVALATGAPVLVAGLATWRRGSKNREASREDFWQRLEQMASVYAVGGASLIAVACAFERWPGEDEAGLIFTLLLIYALIGAGTAIMVASVKQGAAGRAQALVLFACALTAPMAFVFSGSQLAAALLFMALWGVIAAAGLRGGGRGDFQAAVGLIAIRLIVLSFELAGDLLTTGAGLIASGLLVLAVAFGALRIARKFAPPAQTSAGKPG